jgi:hypothetical protein
MVSPSMLHPSVGVWSPNVAAALEDGHLRCPIWRRPPRPCDTAWRRHAVPVRLPAVTVYEHPSASRIAEQIKGLADLSPPAI